MTDIVERLDEATTVLDEPFHRDAISETMTDALTEIRQLRASEARLREALGDAYREGFGEGFSDE